MTTAKYRGRPVLVLAGPGACVGISCMIKDLDLDTYRLARSVYHWREERAAHSMISNSSHVVGHRMCFMCIRCRESSLIKGLERSNVALHSIWPSALHARTCESVRQQLLPSWICPVQRRPLISHIGCRLQLCSAFRGCSQPNRKAAYLAPHVTGVIFVRVFPT